MKKTLLALAVVVSAAVSGSAMAGWQIGAFNDTVNFGGSIDTTDYSQNWAWMAGTGFDSYQNTVKQIDPSTKKLTITPAANSAILLGSTTKAFNIPSLGFGTTPNISFKDVKGNVVNLNWRPDFTGHVSFDLPVVDASDGVTDLGTLEVNATTVGALMGSADLTGSDGVIYSLYSDDANHLFYGGLPAQRLAAINTSDGAFTKLQSFGSLDKASALAQIQINNSSYVEPPVRMTANQTTGINIGGVISAGYAMGFEDGQTMELTFNEMPSQNVTWKAPLSITVSYV